MLNRPYDRNHHGAALMGEPEAWAPHPRHEPPRDQAPEPREARAAPWRQTYVEERLSAAEYRAAPPRQAYATARYAPQRSDPATYGDFHELARAIEERRYRTRGVAPATLGAPRQLEPMQPSRLAPPPPPPEWNTRASRFEAEPLHPRSAPAPERPRPFYERVAQAEPAPVPARRSATWVEDARAEPVAEGPPTRVATAVPARRSTHDAEIIKTLQLTIQALEARIARLESRPLSRFERAREKAEATTAVIAAALPPEPQPSSRSARLREAARAKAEEAQAARAEADGAPVREPSPRRLWA